MKQKASLVRDKFYSIFYEMHSYKFQQHKIIYTLEY